MKSQIITNKHDQTWILLSIAFATFMASLDISIVNISLPTISQHFNVSVSQVSRVAIVYLVVLTGFLLTFGKLADLKGFKNIFLLGFLIFISGSFLCGVSSKFNMLLGGRVIQAIGAAMLTAVAPAMVSAFLPEKIQGRAFGIVGVFSALAISVGPVIGGFLTQYFGWEWIFFVNVPVGILGIIVGKKFLPDNKRAIAGTRFDIPGAVLVFIALTTLLYSFNMGQEHGWTSPIIITCFTVSLVSFIIFIFWEKKITYPLLDFALFKNKNFNNANIASFITMLVLAGTIFLLPFYLELIKGFQVDQSGLILIIPSAVMMLTGPLSGILSDRRSARLFCSAGMFLGIGAFILFAFLKPDSSLLYISFALFWLGFSVGMFISPSTSLIMGHSPHDMQGTASSFLMATKMGASAIGVCIFETIFSQTLPSSVSSGNMSLQQAHIPPEILIKGLQHAFIFGAIACILSFIFSIYAKDKKLCVEVIIEEKEEIVLE